MELRIEKASASKIIGIDGVISKGKQKKRLIAGTTGLTNIAIKEDGDLFINKYLFKEFHVQINGEKKRIWVNISSLAKRTNISKESIQRAKKSQLETLMQRAPSEVEATPVFNELVQYQPKEEREKLKQYARMIGTAIKIAETNQTNIRLHSENGLPGCHVLSTGQVFLDVKQKELVGTGSAKKVKKSYDLFNRRIVARSVIAEEGKMYEHLNFYTSVRAEYDAAKEIDSQYIVEQLGITQYRSKKKKDRYAIFMPLYPQTLKRPKNSLDFNQRKKIAGQLLEALVAINRKGMHRDIKPVNIFLTENDDVRVADFGLYQKRGELAGLRGTLEWIAPEVYRFERNFTKLDVWSAGLILYYLFKKKGAPDLPWNGLVDPARVIKKLMPNWFDTTLHLHEPKLPGLDSLVRDMLKVDPAERISAEEALRRYIEIANLGANTIAAQG